MPTSAGKHLTAHWRSQTASIQESSTEPRYLQNRAWRKNQSTIASFPTPLNQCSNLPWNKTNSGNSRIASISARSRLHTKSPQQGHSLPYEQVEQERVDQIPVSPSWEVMPTRPCESIAEQSFARSDLTSEAEVNQENIRPRLQLRVPGGFAGDEEMPVSPPTIDLAGDVPALLNAVANECVLQQAPRTPHMILPNIGDQGTAETPDTALRLPVATASADRSHRDRSYQVERDSPSSDLASAESVLNAAVMDRSGNLWYIQHTAFGNLSSQLDSPTFARRESRTNNTPPVRGDIHPELPSLAGEAAPMRRQSLVGGPAQQDGDARGANQGWPTKEPRNFARRQVSGYNHSRGAGGHSRQASSYQAREATHSNSRTWISPRTQLPARWAEVQKNLKDMSLIKEGQQSPSGPRVVIGGSFCVPKTLNEWVKHQTDFANDRAKEARQRLHKSQEHKLLTRHPDLPSAGALAPVSIPPFGGARFGDGRGSALALTTIWTPWKQRTGGHDQPASEDRPRALWPCAEEMKEEGNERNTSQYRRFLALPRVPGNATVNWKQKKVLPMLPFDEIWKLPSRETYYDQRAAISPEEIEKMESMIGQELLAAIDCDLSEE